MPCATTTHSFDGQRLMLPVFARPGTRPGTFPAFAPFPAFSFACPGTGSPPRRQDWWCSRCHSSGGPRHPPHSHWHNERSARLSEFASGSPSSLPASCGRHSTSQIARYTCTIYQHGQSQHSISIN